LDLGNYLTVMGNECMERSKACTLPQAPPDEKTLYLCLAILNIFIPGLGMIIIGAIKNDMANLCIGLCQLFIPFVGWIWGIIWGIMWTIQVVQS